MGTKFKHQPQALLLTPSDALEFIANDLLDRLPGTKSGNQNVVTISDRYSKVTSTVRTTDISSAHVT